MSPILNDVRRRLAYLTAIAAISIALTACSSDDEPAYNPDNPEIGTWICSDIQSVAIRSNGGLESHEGMWERDFRKQWLGAKVTISKDAEIENGRFWIERHTAENSNSADEYIVITEATQENLVADYHYSSYYSNGEWFFRKSAVMTFDRK